MVPKRLVRYHSTAPMRLRSTFRSLLGWFSRCPQTTMLGKQRNTHGFRGKPSWSLVSCSVILECEYHDEDIIMDIFQTVCQVCQADNAARVAVTLAVVWPAVSAVGLLGIKSIPVEKLRSHPRLHGLVKILDGLGLDPKRIQEGLIQFFSSKTPPKIEAPKPESSKT